LKKFQIPISLNLFDEGKTNAKLGRDCDLLRGITYVISPFGRNDKTRCKLSACESKNEFKNKIPNSKYNFMLWNLEFIFLEFKVYV